MKKNIILSSFIYLVLGSLFITYETLSYRSVIFFILVTYVCLLKAYNSLKDIDIIFTYFPLIWIIKNTILFVLLKIGWLPSLLEVSAFNWGYDPQRYYFQAKELLENNWIFIGSLNYVGILYYYAIIFYLIDFNPFIPALVNSSFSLFSVIMLVRYVHNLGCLNLLSNYKYLILFLVLVPELIWFDLMTSRESLVQFLLISIIYLTSFSIIGTSNFFKNNLYLFFSLIVVLILAFIRTSMLVPLFIYLFITIIYTKKNKNIFTFILFIPFVIFFLFLYNAINDIFEISNFDLITEFEYISDSNNNVVTKGIEYSNNSISQLLFPSNFLQSILFTPLRLLLYIFSPLPNFGITIQGLLDGQYSPYQNLMVVPTSMLNTLLFPSTLSLTYYTLKWKKNTYINIILLFWIFYFSIAGGNLMVMERYRVMCSLFFYVASIVSLMNVPSRIQKKFYILWIIFIFISYISYITYKNYL